MSRSDGNPIDQGPEARPRPATLPKPVGRHAATIKYDLLTALGTHACGAERNRQRLILRLLTLITARYNWISDEISSGQREIAQLWAIDERSVKRDLAKLRNMGWLVQKRPSARGRVAVHGLDIDRILAETAADWARVGPDYLARMTAEPVQTSAKVIAFPAPPPAEGLWPRIQGALHREDPHLYGAWFAALRSGSAAPGHLALYAPSRFHADYLRANHMARLERAALACDPGLERIEILS